MKTPALTASILAGTLAIASLPFWVSSSYLYFAGYAVLQLVVMATAWNALGGLTGYVNFGSSAFFAIGVYSSVVLAKAWDAPLWMCLIVGGVLAALVGTAMGYLTLRLKGVYFSIATLALSIMLFTLVVNWEYVGGARGAYLVLSGDPPLGLGEWIQWLFVIMAGLAGLSVIVTAVIQRSRIGRGLAAIRDDEVAAEALGVPTLPSKLLITSVSGGLMGLAGTTFPHFLSYVEPSAAFSLTLSINSIAAPLIGGMQSWFGPVVGAVLLGVILQIATVTWSSDFNLIVIGAVLVFFVTLAPQGLLGLSDGWMRRWRR